MPSLVWVRDCRERVGARVKTFKIVPFVGKPKLAASACLWTVRNPP